MTRAILYLLLVPLCAAAGPASTTTQPSSITLRAKDLPVRTLIEQLGKQVGAPLPVTPADLLDKNPPPPVTLDLTRQPFWKVMEEVSRKTGLEPLVSPEDPYPRFQIGLGGGTFWEEPHVVSGPLVIFVNDVQRTNTVELGKKQHQFQRELALNLTAFAEPGLRVLWASPEVTVKSAVDENGRSLKVAGGDASVESAGPNSPGAGVYMWNMVVSLECPAGPAARIARLRGLTRLRIQTRSEKIEIDDVLKARNVTRTVAGIPFTFRSLKKADIEYILQVSLRRDKRPETDWQNLHQSVYNGLMMLYDDKGRLVAGRATENGGDYGNNKIDATLRFVREPGVSDPQAGEPAKLVWLAPTESKDIPVEFELTDLPIPE